MRATGTSIIGSAYAQRTTRLKRRRKNRLSGLETLEHRHLLTSMPIITEFSAFNDATIDDQDGDDSDWIEIYNPGDEDVSLNRWYLTDDNEDLRKWRLPDVSLTPGEYLVVFASGKDRDVAGEELHTSFGLSLRGEYLALVQPDGNTVVSEYDFSEQLPDVSFGVPTGIEDSNLISEGATSRILIPSDETLDPVEPDAIEGTWLDPTLDDSAWSEATTGIGFVPPATAVDMANAEQDFSGVQGQDNWYYGTWAKNFDPDGVYDPGEFTEIAAIRFFDAANNIWSLGENAAKISPTGATPSSASDGFFTNWAIRRWVAETSGALTISGTLGNADGSGDGVTGRILVNGSEVFVGSVNGESSDYSIAVDAKAGDRFDFIIEPGEADDAVGDTATFTSVISGIPEREVPLVQLANSKDDWSRTGELGVNGWYYGYHLATDDADGYQATDFRAFDLSFWSSRRRYQWPDGSAETEISSGNMYPNDEGPVHWPIRRWVSTLDGNLNVEWTVKKSKEGGDGVTGRVFHNGVEVDSLLIAGNDREEYVQNVRIDGVKFGDTIDLAIDPQGNGGDQPDGDLDRTAAGMNIYRIADIEQEISTNIREQMHGNSSSAYIRIPFNVDDVSELDVLTLGMKYDDAFVAYINGQAVASANAPETPAYNSTAIEARPAEDATAFATFDLTNRRAVFSNGTNVLQIHAMNADVNDETLLIVPTLSKGTSIIMADESRFFSQPTPGDENGLGTDQLGPLVTDVQHSPAVPEKTEPIVVTADVRKSFGDIAAVTLTYRVMFDVSVSIPMVDDGTGNDAVAGDGTYTAMIPAEIAEPGQMIRWFVSADDTENRSGRFPAFARPTKDEEYKGTIVADNSLQTEIDVMHWFIDRVRSAENDTGAFSSLFYNGEFYDRVNFSLHGQSSRGFPKKSFNVDMPNDHRLKLSDDFRRVEDFNLLSNYADKAKVRNTLGYEQRAATGGAYHLAFPVRIQHNGEFYAVYDFVEDADERWIERLGYDTSGSLYKNYDTFASPGSAEKKMGDEGNKDDLRDVIAGVRARGEEGLNFIYDNINLAQMVNYLAGFVLTSNVDCCHKNYYSYRDGVTDEWWFLPWDVDLSNGRVWGGFGLAYFDDTMYTNRGFDIGGNNSLISKLYAIPEFKEMYNRRVRTLIDEYVKPPGTPRDQLPLETRVDELVQMMKVDADLDNAEFPANWGQTRFQTFDEAINILFTEYATPRREWLYDQVQTDATGMPVIMSGEPGATTGRYFVPSDDSLGTTWTQPDFDDSGWKSGPMGIGFEDNPDDYQELIKTNIKEDIVGTSVYMRIPFNIDDPAALSALSLRMKYDDGYAAYLNGVEVTRKNLRDDLAWDARARTRSGRSAIEFENVNLTQYLEHLKPGENILAIHGLNSSPTGNDMMFLPELVEGVLTGGAGRLPPGQRDNPKIDFGTIEFSPTSGNQAEEYITLVNNHDTAVDITGWRLDGDVQITFQPGTVIPAGGTLYTSPDVKAFRARAEGPTGGMQLWVQGNYDGNLPNVGGSVQLVATDGEIVNSATFEGETTSVQEHLRVSEIMYNAIGANQQELAADNSLAGEDFEYVELVNISATDTIDLSGVRFTNGIEFDFTGAAVTQLGPGERTLVVRNSDAFAVRYGQDVMGMVAGDFARNTALANAGETLTLIDSGGSVVANISYSDRDDQGWPARADGDGSSLELVDATVGYDLPSNWQASSEINGSPGRDGDAAVSGLVINEVLSRTVAPAVDRIELFNPTDAQVDVQNYFLSDSRTSTDALKQFALPASTVEIGGYLVFDESHFNAGGEQNPNAFGLNGTEGDQLYLTVGDANGPTHFLDAVAFGAAAPGESFGRTPNGLGRLAPMSEQTFGAENSNPRVGPIVINEVNYNPGAPSADALAIHPNLSADDLEFVEVLNPTANPLDLTDWRIRGGIDMTFDDGLQLAAGRALVVTSFNPDNLDNASRTQAFRAHYGLSEDVVLVGGYNGQLSDSGEAVRLRRPGEPSENDPNEIPRLLEDELIYTNADPWPDAAGTGNSLTRTTPTAYGNDATSWVAAAPTPGSVGDVPGDVTGDGIVDNQDIDAVCTARMTSDVSFDINGDGAINEDDTLMLVNDLIGTSVGDVNLDGNFDSSDLVEIFMQGQFEDGTPANSHWATGDWNCDGEFMSDDLLFALQMGRYDTGQEEVPQAAVAAAVLDQRGAAEATTVNTPDVAHLTEPSHARPLLDLETRDALFADRDELFESISDDRDDAANELLAGLQDDETPLD